MRTIRSSYSAFTLIELMISIAIVIGMMIGVNYVFASVGQATGLTQAVSRVTRDAQASQAVMSRDFGTADMSNAPFIMLRSIPTPAFRNRQDYIAAVDNGNPLADVIPHTLADVDNRVHRTDVLTFFARDRFTRQTGGGTLVASGPITPYLGDMAAQEAMISYGHLWLPDNSGSFVPAAGAASYPLNPPIPLTYPGASSLATNPNNYFADQFILGRSAILLQEPDPATDKVVTTRTLRDKNGMATGSLQIEHWHIRGTVGLATHPLRFDAIAQPVGSPTITLQQSRYDLAGTSMSKMKAKFSDPAYWTGAWWNGVIGFHRYQAKPFIMGTAGSRLSPEDLALQAPIFLTNCSQFIVEFAGDFVTQDQNGNVTLDVKDGTIDYFTPSPPSPTGPRTIRWYGFPRDVNGDGRIVVVEGDVGPVRDTRGSDARFERSLGTTLPRPTGNPQDYNAGGGPPPTAQYICAWGQASTEDNRPKMFRILFAIDDPNGRFTDPLMFEYIFKVP